MADYRTVQIESKIRELKEKQQKIYNEMGAMAFSFPTYLSLQSQIDALESEKIGITLNGSRESRSSSTKQARPTSLLGTIESQISFGKAKQEAKKRFHKMSKVKQTLAVVSGQMHQLNSLYQKVKKGKLTYEEAEQKADRMFR